MPKKSPLLAKLYGKVLEQQEQAPGTDSRFYNVHAERALILRERQAALLLQQSTCSMQPDLPMGYIGVGSIISPVRPGSAVEHDYFMFVIL